MIELDGLDVIYLKQALSPRAWGLPQSRDRVYVVGYLKELTPNPAKRQQVMDKFWDAITQAADALASEPCGIDQVRNYTLETADALGQALALPQPAAEPFFTSSW